MFDGYTGTPDRMYSFALFHIHKHFFTTNHFLHRYLSCDILLNINATMMRYHFVTIAATLVSIGSFFSASAQTSADVLQKSRYQMLLTLAGQSDPKTKEALTDALNYLQLEKADVKTLQLKNKTVKFIPVAHAGQKAFYDHVKSIVSAHKKEGYVVYYEEIKKDKPITGNAGKPADTTTLKFRKMIGIVPSRKVYSVLKIVFPDIVTQPVYDSLGITKTDVNADVTVAQIVRQYEKLYGRIRIDSCDVATSMDAMLYPCQALHNNIQPVIEDFRNANLSAMIRQSPHDKILVIYGAKHIGPVMEMLRTGQ